MRRARIHYPGTVYHVIMRGNGGQDIFFDESDRIRFYELLLDLRLLMGDPPHRYGENRNVDQWAIHEVGLENRMNSLLVRRAKVTTALPLSGWLGMGSVGGGAVAQGYGKFIWLLRILWFDTTELCSADDRAGKSLDRAAEGVLRSEKG